MASATTGKIDESPGHGGAVPALDGLRGLAVLIVLLSHLANAGLPVFPGLSMAGTGKSGVYLFFVLSAFLLTRLLLARPLAHWRRPSLWLDYVLRRVLRIWPLYLVVLSASVALFVSGLAPWWPYLIDPASFLRHVLLREGTSVLWSVPVEFHYYLWLPLVAGLFALARRGRAPAAMVGLVAACLVAIAMWVWPPDAAEVNDVRLGPYLSLFIVGAAAASFPASPRPGSVALWSFVGVLATTGVVITTPVCWSLLAGGAMVADLNHRWFLLFGLAWAGLLLSVLRGHEVWRRVFEFLPLRALGWVSFSAYLWHMPVLAMVTGPLRLTGWGAVGAFCLGTAVVSALSWRLIERPLQRVRWPGSS
jgi:peptidoglycan/LPS O-acetylase OafA/YrhL